MDRPFGSQLCVLFDFKPEDLCICAVYDHYHVLGGGDISAVKTQSIKSISKNMEVN